MVRVGEADKQGDSEEWSILYCILERILKFKKNNPSLYHPTFNGIASKLY